MKSHLIAFLCIGVGIVRCQAPLWGQCGGNGWAGPTSCVAGAVCVYLNEYHMQCLAASSVLTPTSSIAVEPTAPPGSLSIKSSCVDTKIQQEWFVGWCLTGKGSKRIQSSVYLGNKLTSTNGELTWGDSGIYTRFCNSCQLQNFSELSCICPTYGKPLYRTTINLGEHIANYKGYLLNDISGPPVVPKQSKPKPFPGDVNWSYDSGNTSCFNTTDPEICAALTFDQTCSGFASTRSIVPSCYYDNFEFEQGSSAMNFKSMAFYATDGAYEFQVWDNLACSGKPSATVKASDYAKCRKFRKPLVAWAAIPQWNADL